MPKVRVANANDVSAMFDVRLSTHENKVTRESLLNDWGITEATVAEALDQERTIAWVAEVGTVIAGFTIADRTSGEILVLAVRPEHEGLSIGKDLLHAACTWLFDNGQESVHLFANPDPSIRAYGFYRYLGWMTTGKMDRGDEEMLLTRAEFERRQ